MSGALSWLSTRARNTLEGGSLWVAFAAGLGAATPVEYMVALVAILSSTAATSAQVSAVVAYTVVAFAVAEIPLVSHLAAPARTHEIMLQLHNWLQTRRRQTVAVIVAVAGVAQTGLASSPLNTGLAQLETPATSVRSTPSSPPRVRSATAVATGRSRR
jgi:hypothetical protein